MDKKNLLILVVVSIIVFLLGGGLGVISQQRGVRQVKLETADGLSSKVVSSILAYGEVTKIEGKNITLNNLGDSLTIPVAGNAKIYLLSGQGNNGASPQQIVEFGSIKVGDKINISFRVLSNGQMEGTLITIF